MASTSHDYTHEFKEAKVGEHHHSEDLEKASNAAEEIGLEHAIHGSTTNIFDSIQAESEDPLSQ